MIILHYHSHNITVIFICCLEPSLAISGFTLIAETSLENQTMEKYFSLLSGEGELCLPTTLCATFPSFFPFVFHTVTPLASMLLYGL